MHHFFEAITNNKGDALTGYFCRVVDPTSGNPVSLYADESLTPIISVSGVADAALVDGNGDVNFYVATGTYHLDIYASDATTFVLRVPNVGMNIDVNTAAIAVAAQTSASNSATAAANSASSASTSATSASSSASSAATSATSASGSASSAAASANAAATSISGITNATAHAANRTALSALGTSSPAFLYESGREGTFVWDGSNHSTHVTADPNQGVYVAPASDTSGASGAWVRKFSGRVNVKWFGAVADWNGTTGTDNGAAFTAALSFINATAFSGTSTFANANVGLYIPYGKYWLNSTTLDIRTNIIIEGDGVGENGGQATFLKWAAGTTGIRVQASNTTGATASQTQDNSKSGAASIIRNLYLEGGYTSANGSVYGIQLRARASIRDCWINNFEGDGIYAVATAGGSPEGNCNNFEIQKVNINGCRNGIYTSGADVNAGVVIAADCMNNRAWGVSENSFLGNTYIACHTSGNTSGPYQTTNNNSANVFTGCYSESGQPNSAFVYPTVIVGGLHAAGVSGTGNWLRSANSGSLFTENFEATTGIIDHVQTNGGLVLESGAQQVIYSSFNGGNYILSGVNVSIGGSPVAGFSFGNTAGGGIPAYLQSTSLTWVYSGDGFVKLVVDNTGVNLASGCAYKVNGTTVINGSGVLQAAAFPVLAGDLTSAGGTLSVTIASNAVTYAKMQQVAASSLVGNPTGSLANAQGITLAADHSFSGTTLQLGAFTGDVTKSAGSLATTISSATVVSKVAAQAIAPASVAATGAVTSSGATSGVGYATGAGGTVTQLTSRTTGVTLNKVCGAITLFSAAGSATWATFTVTNSAVAATDTVEVVQKSGANLYNVIVTGVAAGSFNLSVSAVSGTATEAPVFNFVVTKAVTA